MNERCEKNMGGITTSFILMNERYGKSIQKNCILTMVNFKNANNKNVYRQFNFEMYNFIIQFVIN